MEANFNFVSFQSGLNEWHLIFWIGAAVYIGAGIVFCIFGSGQTQPWNSVGQVPKPTEPANGIDNPAYEATASSKQDNTKV